MSHIAIFDLDGTLVDTAPDLIGGLNQAMSTEGLKPVPVEAAHGLVGAGVRALIERGLEHHGHSVSPQRYEELVQVFLAHYEANIAATSRPYPGVDETLLDLKSQGWRLAVCTNKMHHLAVRLISELKMTHWFDAITGGDSFAFKKPDPRHLTETAALAGGGTAIMVGDSRADVDAARAAGIPIVGVTFGYTDIPMRDLKPDVLIEHFAELPRALHRLT